MVADAELASSRPETDGFILATLGLINVPRSEDDLVSEQLCFGGGNPDQEIGRKRDWKERMTFSYLHSTQIGDKGRVQLILTVIIGVWQFYRLR